jgi:prevent-host-death family protein
MNPKTIGTYEARTRLSELPEHVRKGQVYRISKRGRPVAELRPPPQSRQRPRFGCDKGRVTIGSDFGRTATGRVMQQHRDANPLCTHVSPLPPPFPVQGRGSKEGQ